MCDEAGSADDLGRCCFALILTPYFSCRSTQLINFVTLRVTVECLSTADEERRAEALLRLTRMPLARLLEDCKAASAAVAAAAGEMDPGAVEEMQLWLAIDAPDLARVDYVLLDDAVRNLRRDPEQLQLGLPALDARLSYSDFRQQVYGDFSRDASVHRLQRVGHLPAVGALLRELGRWQEDLPPEASHDR